MDFHIIAILGLVGKDKEGNFTKATYSKDTELDLPKLNDGVFHNSTHCLIESFGEDATYTFIGTAESIKYQNDIFDILPKQCRDIFKKYKPIELPTTNEIEDIFNNVLEIIKSTQSQNIILDITHGFRSHPIIASFASILGQINTKKSITLLFAKEIEKDKKYQYTSLERYLEMSLVAISLQTFSQTLSVPKVDSLDKNKYPFIDTLTRFSNALHANAFAQIFGLLNEAKNELQKNQKWH